jgi:hypothetical protein
MLKKVALFQYKRRCPLNSRLCKAQVWSWHSGEKQNICPCQESDYNSPIVQIVSIVTIQTELSPLTFQSFLVF